MLTTPRKRPESHGLTGTPTYFSWHNMRTRCLDPNSPVYASYGGRGIKVCRRWLDSVAAFAADMGEQPPGMTLDRIDTNGDYTPENCRWATPREQANNTRSNHRITVHGETDTVANWARRSGIEYTALLYRIQAGWNADDAVYTPAGDSGTIHLTFQGRAMKVSEWAAETGLPVLTIHKRIRAGWHVDRILGTPSRVGLSKRPLTFDGVTMSEEEWAAKEGVTMKTFRRRIAKRALQPPES